MDSVNKKLMLNRKTFSKSLVILFAVLLCSVIVISTADDSTAEVDDEFIDDGINYVITSEINSTVKIGSNSDASPSSTLRRLN